MTASAGEISKDIERIAAIAGESTNSSQGTVRAASELSGLSSHLQKVLSGFKLE
jgi:methyl-accepting chemotaxis protein